MFNEMSYQIEIAGLFSHPDMGSHYVESFKTFIDEDFGVVSMIAALIDGREWVIPSVEEFVVSGGEINVWS